MIKNNFEGELPNTFDTFYNSILSYSTQALKINNFLDNFDRERFNFGGQDRSEQFRAPPNSFDWFIKNSTDLYSAYLCLSNNESKTLYLYLISFRLAGHFCVKLPVSCAEKTASLAEYKAIEKGTKSELAIDGMFGELKHFDFEYKGSRYTADCLSLESYLFHKQYFYVMDSISIEPQVGDIVIDGGACTGDTALIFSNAVGPSGKVYAFDLVDEHLKILAYNIKQFTYKNVVIMPWGISDKEVLSTPIVLNQYSPGFCSRGHNVPLRSIDHLISTGEIESIDFIKMDIEGAEMEALRGAKDSINSFKPKLAISLYHKPNDLFEIILYIKETFPFYTFYIGHYTIHTEETVLYCQAV